MDKKLCTGPQIAYWGTDPTDDSLHIGNLASLTMLRWWQKTEINQVNLSFPAGNVFAIGIFEIQKIKP